jgi:3D (Asp-Asp-Asp) domain-containing protein
MKNILIIIFILTIIVYTAYATTTVDAPTISNPITIEEEIIKEEVQIETSQKESTAEQTITPTVKTQPQVKVEEKPIAQQQVPIQEEVQTANNTIYLGNFKISAYCHCARCCGKSDGITATGTKATANRTIAVDPRSIPLGSKVIIDGQTYIAEDTGGAIKGNKIDMYFATHQEALNWGIQYKDVQLITQ